MEITPKEYRAILRRDLTTFAARSFYELNSGTDLHLGQYIELLCSRLAQCVFGNCKRLIINLPPRSLKSHVGSVALPAFILGHNPTAQIICASYSQELSEKHARDCRSVMSSSFYREIFPRAAISPNRQAVNDFATTMNGFRMATSVGGSLTGRGADFLILDDILKPSDALSETTRKATNEWFFNTLLSRLNDKQEGVIILIMQRLHQEDLVGEILDRESDGWEVLSLPAIATRSERYAYQGLMGENEVFCRGVGEALHPERDSIDVYQKIRREIGDYIFSSQYQQSPSPLSRNVIQRDWIKTYTPEQKPKNFSFVVQSWDTANKGGELNDYSVCTTWGVDDQGFYLLHVYRRRNTYPQLKQAVLDQIQRFDPCKVVIEDKASGTILIQELKLDGAWQIEAYAPPTGCDKFMRFAAQAIKFESGKIFVPTEAPWLEDYIAEITGFPGSKHDDQVDSTSQALDILTRIAPWAGRGEDASPANLYPSYVRETW